MLAIQGKYALLVTNASTKTSPIDLDQDLACTWHLHINLLDRSGGGLASALPDSGALLIGDVDGAHGCSREYRKQVWYRD